MPLSHTPSTTSTATDIAQKHCLGRPVYRPQALLTARQKQSRTRQLPSQQLPLSPARIRRNTSPRLSLRNTQWLLLVHPRRRSPLQPSPNLSLDLRTRQHPLHPAHRPPDRPLRTSSALQSHRENLLPAQYPCPIPSLLRPRSPLPRAPRTLPRTVRRPTSRLIPGTLLYGRLRVGSRSAECPAGQRR